MLLTSATVGRPAAGWTGSSLQQAGPLRLVPQRYGRATFDKVKSHLAENAAESPRRTEMSFSSASFDFFPPKLKALSCNARREVHLWSLSSSAPSFIPSIYSFFLPSHLVILVFDPLLSELLSFLFVLHSFLPSFHLYPLSFSFFVSFFTSFQTLFASFHSYFWFVSGSFLPFILLFFFPSFLPSSHSFLPFILFLLPDLFSFLVFLLCYLVSVFFSVLSHYLPPPTIFTPLTLRSHSRSLPGVTGQK